MKRAVAAHRLDSRTPELYSLDWRAYGRIWENRYGATRVVSDGKVDNYIHADMHPGNILVRISRSWHPSKGLFKSRPHLVFLDVGLIAELSSSDRINLLEFFKAVALQDGHTAAMCALRFSKRQKCPNPGAFIEEVEESCSICLSKFDAIGSISMLVLEGWQRKLDPDYDVMKTLRSLLLRSDWAKSLQSTIVGLTGP